MLPLPSSYNGAVITKAINRDRWRPLEVGLVGWTGNDDEIGLVELAVTTSQLTHLVTGK
jgi:hypothetical protein